MPDFLPNLFVLGAARCGTTTLHSYLSDMSEICMSDPKEPIYFECESFHFECEYEKGLEYYRQTYFTHWRNERIIGEACPRNLYLPYVPERIHRVNPNAKLVVLIRNPIDRAFSHWQLSYSAGREKLKFHQAISADYERIKNGLHLKTAAERVKYCNSLYASLSIGSKKAAEGLNRNYLDFGYYYEQIKRYIDLFPSSSLKVIFFEDLIDKPNEVINTIRSFLELEPYSDKEDYVLHQNPSITRLHFKILELTARLRYSRLMPVGIKQYVEQVLKKIEPQYKMKPETREWLYNHYYEHNLALERFLVRDLSHWK